MSLPPRRIVDFSALCAAIDSALDEERMIVALAGSPAAGKSTLAERLCTELNEERPGRASALGMDGFHFDDRLLEARGWRSRKGAPHTFDVGGLAACLRRLRENTEPEVAIPVFDRSIEIARAGAAAVPQSTQIIIVEGNYLLLADAPWSRLRACFDLTILIDVEETTVETRLMRRWRDLDLPEEEARRRVEANDLPNAALTRERSAAPDILYAPQSPSRN